MTKPNDSEPRSGDPTTEMPCIDMPVDAGEPVATRHAALTDTGLVRDHNEDNFLVMPDHGVFLVADGMGGHNAGSLASETCVETVREFFEETDVSDTDPQAHVANPSLAEALIRSNRAILDKSHSSIEFSGMGTTAVGFRITGNKVSLAHAGDSRAYLFRNGMFEQLTSDHSLGNFLRELGREDEAIMAEQTMSNVIMRALGLEPEIEIETNYLFVQPGDRLLLCSDGLTDMVGDQEIRMALLARRFSREDVVQHLIEQALDAGGRDNVTVVLVDVVSQDHEDDDLIEQSGGTLRMTAESID